MDLRVATIMLCSAIKLPKCIWIYLLRANGLKYYFSREVVGKEKMETIFYECCCNGNLALLKKSFTNRKKNFNSGLLTACRYNQPHVVEFLLEKGANNYTEGFNWTKNPEIEKLLTTSQMKNMTGDMTGTVCSMIEKGDFETINKLIDCEVNCNRVLTSLLQEGTNMELIKRFFIKGQPFDDNIYYRYINTERYLDFIIFVDSCGILLNFYKIAALAIRAEKKEVILFAVRKGVNINKVMIYASSLAIMEYLVHLGGTNFSEPLDCICYKKKFDIAHYLIRCGAANCQEVFEKYCATDRLDITEFFAASGRVDLNKGLSIAIKFGQKTTIEFLEKNGVCVKDNYLKKNLLERFKQKQFVYLKNCCETDKVFCKIILKLAIKFENKEIIEYAASYLIKHI